MSKLAELKVKRLLKRLEYVEEEYDFRNEVILEADPEFLGSINDFLNNNPEIKKIYDEKINRQIEDAINKSTEKEKDIQEIEEFELENEGDNSDSSEDTTSDNEDVVNEPIQKAKNNLSPKIKSLYREIVKKTHPDKIKDEKLNALYIEATDFYNEGDKLGIYKICGDLGIEYTLDDEDYVDIEKRIKKLESKISFMESTFTWKWVNAETDEMKNNIIVTFIKQKLNN